MLRKQDAIFTVRAYTPLWADGDKLYNNGSVLVYYSCSASWNLYHWIDLIQTLQPLFCVGLLFLFSVVQLASLDWLDTNNTTPVLCWFTFLVKRRAFGIIGLIVMSRSVSPRIIGVLGLSDGIISRLPCIFNLDSYHKDLRRALASNWIFFLTLCGFELGTQSMSETVPLCHAHKLRWR